MENYLESFYSIRFSDCDPFRHLNNARYIDYFMNAREDHLRDHYQLDLADFYKKGLGWVVTQHDIRYLRPASHNETVSIRTGLLEAGPEHLLVEMIMLDEKGSQLKAILHSHFVPVNLVNGRKEPHSEEFMAFLEDQVIPRPDDGRPDLNSRVQELIQSLKLASLQTN